MSSEARVCQNCKSSFTIASEDFLFYEKMQVPAPTLCSACRSQRRLAWRNERTLYWATCALCKKPTLSVYHPQSACKGYCVECFYSEKWDGETWGREVDFSRPFFEQFNELLKETPHLALLQLENENCEFANYAGRCKNGYLISAAWVNEDCYYCRWVFHCKNSLDSYKMNECEIAYSDSDCQKCYNTHFSYNSVGCTDSYFLDNCIDCTNCFGCKNLKSKQYYAFNKPVPKEEFEKLVSSLGSYQEQSVVRAKVRVHFLQYPNKFIITRQAVDCSGCYLTNTARCRHCYDVNKAEDMVYCNDLDNMKDGYDIDFQQDGEHNYELVTGAAPNYCRFVVTAVNNTYVDYSMECIGSEQLFGCVSMRKKKFAILNKVYSEQEYVALKDKLIAHMKKTGEWGEFFPAAISPFGYNETVANWNFPRTREEVLAQGWKWQEQLPGTYGKETMRADQVPDQVKDVDEKILQETFACVECKKNFRLIKPELLFYKRLGFALPRACPECRLAQCRIARNPRILFNRKCMCKNQEHGHGEMCASIFETTYAPERAEIVYCEQCYQSEVV